MRTENHRKAIVSAYKIAGTKRTDRECHLCGEGNFLKRGHELICENCNYSPDVDETAPQPSPWEDFWKGREQYSGFTGPDRIRMVGGFAGAYEYGGEADPY